MSNRRCAALGLRGTSLPVPLLASAPESLRLGRLSRVARGRSGLSRSTRQTQRVSRRQRPRPDRTEFPGIPCDRPGRDARACYSLPDRGVGRSPIARSISRAPDRDRMYGQPETRVMLRSPMGCGGRLFGPWVSDCSISTCSSDTVPMPCMTIHRTPSEHGGVVSEPLYP